VHYGHDLGQILWPHTQVDTHSTGVVVSLAGILTIQNGRNARCETHIEDFFGIRDACRNAGNDLSISQYLEGFVFRHAHILTQLRVQGWDNLA